MSVTHMRAMRSIMAAVLESIPSDPIGAPEGPLYAALMTQGCTLSTFQALTGAMVSTGAVTRSGDCLHRGPKYSEILTRLQGAA